jgi:hypothetical protein
VPLFRNLHEQDARMVEEVRNHVAKMTAQHQGK